MGFRRYDVLIITALFDELEAVLAFGEGGKGGWSKEKDRDGFPFHFRELPREEGGEPLRVAAASFDEMGGDATAARAAVLIQFLDPASLAMCGICAGKKQDVFLGDVIVASRVYRYDSGKFSATRRAEGGSRSEEFFHDFKTFNLKDTWRMDAAYFAREKDWTSELVKRRPLSLETQQKWFLLTLREHEEHGAAAPDKHPDRKKNCPSFTAVRDRLRRRGLLVNKPGLLQLTDEGMGHAIDLSHEDESPRDPEFCIHVGPIATAEVVQKDPELFDRLERIGRKTLGAEMEAAALGRVGEQLGRPTLIVKAVSDYGDEDKDDAFRRFAARAAAQVLIRLLLRNLEPVEQRFEETPAFEPRESGQFLFERMGLERRDDLLSRVQTLARLKMAAKQETAEIVRLRAPAPFDEYLRVTKAEGPFTIVFPVATVDEFSAKVFEDFLDKIDARYRRNDPGIRSELVYGGTPPASEVISKAAARRVLLQSFTEYEGLIDFRGYLKRQVERLEKDPAYPLALYVDQCAVLQSDAGEFSTSNALAELNALLASSHPRFILVLGEFGTGKTFLLHELARRMAKAEGALVPVLIEMRMLEKAQDLNSLVAHHMPKAGIERIDLPAFHHMLAHGRIVLLFDGFDELALRVSYERAAEHFSTLVQAAQGEAKIVITSRTQHFYSDQQVKSALGEQASSQRGYRLVRLQRFTREQILSFLENRLGDKADAARRLALLTEVKDLMGLAENPRMLGFIADISEEKLLEARARDKEITSASLYELLLTQWLQHEYDRAHPRGGLPGLDLRQRWSAVTDLAMRLWHRMERSLNILELPAELTAAVKELAKHPISPEEVQHQIGSGTLLVRDEGNNFSFIHQSVMEWLVAKAVAQGLRSGAAEGALRTREMSPLMADFVWGLAGREAAEQWAQEALHTVDSGLLRRNALLMLERLSVEAREGAQLARQDLSGRDFSRKSLRYADLSGANLIDAKLVRTDLTGANLTGALLRRANLSEAMIINADLRAADLSGARLMGSILAGTHLEGVILRQACLLGATFDPGALEALGEEGLFGAALPADAGWASPMLSSVVECRAIAISPDGKLLFSGHGNGARIWDLKTESVLRILKGHQDLVWSVAVSPDGKMLASSSADGTVRLWEVATGRERGVLQGHGERVFRVAFSPDGDTLASGSEDGTVRLWNMATGREWGVLKGNGQRVVSVAFSPDGYTLASGSEDGTVRLWEVATGRKRGVIQGHAQLVWSVAFSPDGYTLASGSDDGTVRLWDVDTGRERGVLRGHEQRVMSVAFSLDGNMLASGSWDGTVRLWDVDTGRERSVLQGYEQRVMGVAFSPDGYTLASGSDDGAVRLWAVDTGRERSVLQGHGQRVMSVAFSPKGDTLASSREDGTVRLWEVDTGRERGMLQGHGQRVWSVAFSPQGDTLASGSWDGTVRLWEVATGRERGVLRGYGQRVWSVAFSPDGYTLASGSDDGAVRLWEVAKGRKRSVLQGHEQRVVSVVFSPNGDMLASGSEDGTVRLWEVAKVPSRYRGVLEGHEQRVVSVAFSPKGDTLASGSDDGTVRLWEVATGRERGVLQGHEQKVFSVAFSPKGDMLASGGDDGTVRLWEVATGRCLVALASLDEGWVAFTPEGRYRSAGDLGGDFWHVIGLCRFEPGELTSLRVSDQEPLYRLPA